MTGSSTARRRLEKLLLLSCARTDADAARVERIRALSREDLNWAYLVGAAVEQGVAPLLYLQLKNGCTEVVPPFWIEHLRQLFQQNAHRNLFLAAELLRILDGFRASDLLAVPYKGPVLAEQAYGNLALRQFADLDVVVRHRDVAAVHDVMVAEGYRAKFPALSAAGGKIPGQYLFTRDTDGTLVEFHTERTLRYFPIPLRWEALSGRLEQVSVSGHAVATFCPEDALPILCVHGSKDFWERLIWIADIAALVQIPREIDWETCLRRAREMGAARLLFLGLSLADGLLGAPLPEEIQRKVRTDRAVQRLTGQVRNRFFAEIPGDWSTLERLGFRMRMRETLWQGSGYVLRLALAPTEEDWSRVRLPGALSPLYAALRPFRLLRDYGLGIKRDSDRVPSGKGSGAQPKRPRRAGSSEKN